MDDHSGSEIIQTSILKNFSALLLAQMVSMIAGIGSTIWLARHLGPESFGFLNFGVALLTYFFVAASLGTDIVAARNIARNTPSAPDIASDTVGLRIFLAVVAYMLFAGAVFVVRDQPPEQLILLAQGTVLFAAAATPEFIFQGLERMGMNAIRQVIQAVLILLGAVIFVSSPSDLMIAAILLPFAAFVSGAWLLGLVIKTLPNFRVRIRPNVWWGMIKASYPFALVALVHTVLLSFDIVMIGLLLDDFTVGLYAAAMKLLTLAMIPSSMLISSWYPALSRNFGDTQAMQREGDAFTRYALSLGVPAACIGVVFAPATLIGLFGSAFSEDTVVASLLMFVTGIMHLAVAVCSPLAAWNQERVLAKIYLSGAAANVVLNFILIPIYSGIGAAVASGVSYLLIVILSAIIYFRTAQGFPWRALRAAAVSAALLLPTAFGIGYLVIDRLPPLPTAIVGTIASFAVYIVIARYAGLLPASALIYLRNRLRPGQTQS